MTRSTLTALAAMAVALLSVVPAAADDPAGLYIAPYLQNVTPAGITIMWETTDSVVGTVEYSEGDGFDHQVSETSPVKIHEIHLAGLKTGTKYYYRVRYEDVILPPASFTTAPPPGTGTWRLVVYGDNRTNPDTHEGNVKQIMKLNPGIVLNSGDLVSQGSDYKQWKPQYFDPLRGLAEYVPIFTCLGNHEQNADHYYNYASVPDENDEVYYSFDYGNAHIIGLNSNARDAPYQPGDPQTEWLIRDLEANKDKQWTIVFFHHPLFRCHPGRGIEGQRWVWQPIFDKYGVDLIVNGHDHYYQRTYAVGSYTGVPRRGVFHLISGGGGAGTYPIIPKIHAAVRRRVHHITVMDFQGDRIVGRAVDIEGNTFDAFVYDKQSVASAEEFIAYEGYLLERDIGTAIREMPAVEAGPDGATVNTVLEIPNPFEVPLLMTLTWEGTPGWQVASHGTVTLEPGIPIRIPIRAEGRAGALYPVPTATVSFSKPDNEKAFRNDVLTFYPIKLSDPRTVKPAKARVAPIIDGDLSDNAWDRSKNLGDFIDVQGSRTSTRYVKARVLRDADNLYVAARVEAPTEVLAKGYEGRDNGRAQRNDHFRVHIGVDSQAYTFLVSAVGTQMDARGRNNEDGREWNSAFQSAVAPTEDGWQVEMAIPLADLKPEDGNLRINLARRDATENSECELTPTFGKSGLDHRVPMYRGDWEATDRFSDLRID